MNIITPPFLTSQNIGRKLAEPRGGGKKSPSEFLGQTDPSSQGILAAQTFFLSLM